MDENTDGRISYHEMKNYLVSLGFDVESLEGDPKALAQYEKGQQKKDKKTQNMQKLKEHKWRDKALELLIKTMRAKLVSKTNKKE